MNAADREQLRNEISRRVAEREHNRRALSCEWCNAEIDHDRAGNGKPRRFCSEAHRRKWHGIYKRQTPPKATAP